MVDQGYTTFDYMMMQMVVDHGGRCAERVVFGDDVTDVGVDDLEKITKVVYCFFIYNQDSSTGHSSDQSNKYDDISTQLVHSQDQCIS